MCAALYLELLVAAIFGGKKQVWLNCLEELQKGGRLIDMLLAHTEQKVMKVSLGKRTLKSTGPIVSRSQTLSLSREREGESGYARLILIL